MASFRLHQQSASVVKTCDVMLHSVLNSSFLSMNKSIYCSALFHSYENVPIVEK